MKKIFLMMFVMVLLVGTVSAFEWDNVKNYNEETKTVEIRNSILGIPFLQLDRVAEITLLSPQLKKMTSAQDNFFEIEINNFDLYSDVISKMEYHKLKNGVIRKEIQKNNYWMYYNLDADREVINYNQSCNGFLGNGTEDCSYEKIITIEKGAWIPFNNSESLPIGKVRLRNYIEIAEFEWVEYIPTFYGVKILEWAGVGNDGFTTLLLHLDGTQGGTDFPDVAAGNTSTHTFAANGDAATNTSIVQFGTGALKCDGSGDWVQQVEIDSTDVELVGGTDFTLDFWTYPLAAPTGQDDMINIRGLASTNADVRVIITPNVRVIMNGLPDFTSNTSLTVGVWTHVAITREGTSIRVFQGGLITASTTSSVASGGGTGRKIVLCSANGGGFAYNGLIDEVRYSNGIARFTTDFTPPTEAYGQALNINVISPTNNSNFSISTIFFNATSSLTIDKWIVNYNGTNVTLSDINTSLTVEDGSFQLLMYGNDTDGDFALNDSIFFGVDTIAPTLNVTSPLGVITFKDITENQTLNFNVSDINLDTCIFEYDGVNITTDCATNTTNFTLSTPRNLTFFVNDTGGNAISQFVNWSYFVLQTSTSFNSSSFETAQETFTVNVTTNGSVVTAASLTFDGTENTGATITNPVADNFSITKTITIPTSIGNKTHNFNLTIIGKVINTTPQTQLINVTNLTICGAVPQNIPFINITFKNETLAEEDITATISSTWIYSLSAIAEINKTLTFTDATENLNYTFCVTPNRTLNVQIDIDYDNSISQQRSFSSTRTISNITATEVLYLLPTALGIFSPFKTTNINGDTIDFVSATITRVLNAVTITVANGLTDSSGFATFFLNPNVAHTATFSKTGFIDNVFVFTPTTDLRTVVMGGGGIISNGTIISRGTTYVIDPKQTTLDNNTNFTFTFNVTSNLTSITLISMNITNSSGAELLFVSNAGVGNLSGVLNTENNTKLFGNYIIQTAEETISVTRIWTIFTSFIGDYSIFRQLILTEENELISELNRLLLILALMFGIIIFMSVGQILETSESKIAVLLLLTWAFSLVGWLDTGLAVSTTDSGINRLGEFSNQFGIAILTSGASILFILRRVFIRRP